MRCAVIQPSYIPWRGYFDMIGRSDLFVFYDDVQFDKHGWRNRNRIKTAAGPAWLTIPVQKKGNVERAIRIDEIEIATATGWNRKHLASLRQSYARAPYLERYMPLLERHLTEPPRLLAELTIPLTVEIARELGYRTEFRRSSEMNLSGDRAERLLDLLGQVGATEYLSGPAAGSYIDPAAFEAAGIELEYMAYDYGEYPQLHPPYEPQVSIVDLLFMCGPEADRHLGPCPGETYDQQSWRR
ncbi:MAG: WbqC family protein [Solirubrobacterales bacterium]|nr:WbqC family protein [Solirubrobacterales bacterium]